MLSHSYRYLITLLSRRTHGPGKAGLLASSDYCLNCHQHFESSSLDLTYNETCRQCSGGTDPHGLPAVLRRDGPARPADRAPAGRTRPACRPCSGGTDLPVLPPVLRRAVIAPPVSRPLKRMTVPVLRSCLPVQLISELPARPPDRLSDRQADRQAAGPADRSSSRHVTAAPKRKGPGAGGFRLRFRGPPSDVRSGPPRPPPARQAPAAAPGRGGGAPGSRHGARTTRWDPDPEPQVRRPALSGSRPSRPPGRAPGRRRG
jgi:hypothetical protein